MRTIRIYVFCISLLCYDSLLAFPIQDSSHAEDSRREHHVYENVDNSVRARFPRASLTSSRLQRLLGIYMNVLGSELKRSTDYRIPDVKDRHDNSDVDDYRNSFIYEDGLRKKISPAVTAHKSIPSVLNDEVQDSERPKRQQGWYVQYGKRNNDKIYSTEVTDHQPISSGNIVYNDNQEMPLLTTSLENSKEKPATTVISRIVLLTQDPMNFSVSDDSGSNTSGNIDTSDSRNINLKSEEWGSEPRIRNIKRNHQGWFTQYGKRSEDDVHVFVL